MNTEQQQCCLAVLGLYALRRRNGSLAIDGLSGPVTAAAIREFQQQYRSRPDGSELTVDGLWGPQTENAVRQVIGAREVPQNPECGAGESIPDWWEKYPAVHRNDWRCRCGGRYCSGYPVEPQEETVAMLQKFAEHFGKEILWNSGLRCPGYNASVPGASPRSKHCLGMAYDFHMEGVSPQMLADFGETLMPDRGGIGIYSWGIHLDNRSQKARWQG